MVHGTGGIKKWGKGEFWGLTQDFDHDWMLTDEQKGIRDELIEVCRTKIRPHAVHCDKTYEYPRKSLNELAKLRLLALIVPKELGGRGQNHLCATMISETIARYGCPSTAMVYTMHMGAVAAILLRHHDNKLIKDLLKRIDSEALVGTLSYSDPTTGGHYWFSICAKVKEIDDHRLKILKYGSWATSAGHADWYAVQTLSPEFGGDYKNLSTFLVYKDEVRAATDDWSALGMHGNQSGSLIVEAVFNKDRLIGPYGDGALSMDETVDPYFLSMSAGVWNGIALGCLDIAKKHVTRKAHADLGVRICDYPTIQDYFGNCISMTNASRSHIFLVSQALDNDFKDGWQNYKDLTYSPKAKFLSWLWQGKYVAAKNVDKVGDKMLHACGGSGFKTDLGLERLIRDGKAAWVMGQSNEVLRQLVGRASLMGMQVVDFWEEQCNERMLHHELGKMSIDSKRDLVKRLQQEVALVDSGEKGTHPFQDTDFENPFNTGPPKPNNKTITKAGKSHAAAFDPEKWTSLPLLKSFAVSDKLSSYTFSLPKETDHTGCLPGQYVQVRATIDGKHHERYFSPVSRPDDFGKIEIVLRFQVQGLMTNFFKNITEGDLLEFRGPCGGFEYEANKLNEMTIIASGGGITPGMQIIRCIMKDTNDKVKINLLYYAEDLDNILYKEELDAYKDVDSRLKIAYSLGEVPEDWDGSEGFIDTSMIEKCVTKYDGDYKHKVLICGGPTMAIGCLDSLRMVGFPSDMIFIYGQFGTEQLRAVYGRVGTKLSGHTCADVKVAGGI